MPINFNNGTRVATCSVVGLATQIFTGYCVLERIVMNVSTIVTIGIIDGTSGTTINKALIYKNPTSGDYTYNMVMGNGIRLIMTGAGNIKPDITVVYHS